MRSTLLPAALFVMCACAPSESMDSSGSLLRDTTGSTAPSSSVAAQGSSAAGAGAPGSSGAAPGGSTTTPRTMTSAAAAGAPAATSGSAVGTPAAAAGTGSTATAAAGSSGGSTSAQAPGTGAAGGGAGSAATSAGPTTMAAAGAGGSGAAAAGGASMGTLTLKFTTKSYGGFYAPLNYGAVWFESKDGKFLKTVKRWAGLAHASDLGAWTKASGGWGGLFGGMGNTADMMDAMSSATLRQHETHTVMWNMKDVDKMLVPDGDYVAVVELTEDRAAMPGPVLRVPFKKGAEPQMVQPADEKSFTGISLTYQP